MARDTEKFLQILNIQNERISAKATKVVEIKAAETDKVRVKRDQERREKWGQLRAREQPGKRPRSVHNVFGHVDPY